MTTKTDYCPTACPRCYVPAITQLPHEEMAVEERTSDGEQRFTDREVFSLVSDCLSTESLYLAGQPGSGKSTFSQWLVYVIAKSSLPE